jgi:hypothetical protein
LNGPADSLKVNENLLHRHRDGGRVTQTAHPERVSDKQHVNPCLVEEPG